MAATLVVQCYLEGDKAAVQEALAPKADPPPPAAAAPPSPAEAGSAGEAEEAAAPRPAFDTIVVTVAVAEAFPDGRLRSPVQLHLGCVAHSGAKWRPPPPGWQNQPISADSGGSGLPWVPLQRFMMTQPGGGSVLIDPECHGTCLRLPLAEMAARGLRGMEFVLKTKDERWVQQGGGASSNFYIELPVPRK